MREHRYAKIAVAGSLLGLLMGAPALSADAPVAMAAVSAEQASQAETYFATGKQFAMKRYFDRAMEDFNRAISLDPGKAEYYDARGNLYYILGHMKYTEGTGEKLQGEALQNFLKAAEDYNEAIKLAPDNISYYQARGIVYDALDEPDAALADYNKVIAARPSDYSIYDRRALAYLDKGDFAAAFKDLDKALALNPKDDINSYYRGLAYGRQGKLSEAMAMLDKATSTNKWFAEPWMIKGVIYERMNKPLEAYQAYVEFLARDLEKNPYNQAFVKNRMETILKS